MGLVLALVGSFGSGCTYIADEILIGLDFEKISLSDVLRKEFEKEHGPDVPLRSVLQEYGTEIRQKKGSGYLAEQAIREIEKNPDLNYVIDSIRNPAEIEKLKFCLGRDLIIMGVYASKDVRWERVSKIYHDDLGQFNKDDEVDQDQGVSHGQRVTACYLYADIIIKNELRIHNHQSKAFYFLKGQIDRCLSLVVKPGSEPPTEETLMAVAYANSQRSSCRKRRVGSIIVDNKGHILSSGYNEVPGINAMPCFEEYGKCYRDKIKEEFATEINSHGVSEDISRSIQKSMWSEFKVLDRCRALHAEEQAILNLVRFGSRIENAMTMYVTTYPCNLCTNKIIEVGINKIVYFEPYSVEESREILDRARVEQQPFFGVAFNGYFRLFGGMPNANVS